MKKKKRSRGSKSGGGGSGGGGGGGSGSGVRRDEGGSVVEEEALRSLIEVFASCSMEEAEAAYKEANGDVNKAAEILEGLVDSIEDKSTSCSTSSFEDKSMMGSSSSWNVGSSSSSGSSLPDVFGGDECVGNEGGKQKGRGKKVVAAAGTVSLMLGKDYVRSIPKKNSSKVKGYSESSLSKEDAEQFLSSMLGDNCELSLAVVRDVLCQCEYDVEKALNVLLELSASSTTHTKSDENNLNIRDSDGIPTNRAFDSTSHSLDTGPYDSIWSIGTDQRNRYKGLIGTEPEAYSSRESEYIESELPQKVLESLFNMPAVKNAEHQPSNMNWRSVAKKLTSLGQNVESYPSNGEAKHINLAKGDDYVVYRESAKQHWESMRSYYQKAATAYANGEREHAAYLSEKGQKQSQRAREADEKASKDIFVARNKSIENRITIDLHGQHVKQAMKLLKLHLLFGAYVRSVRLFRVITGCGRHGVGKSKLKLTVIGLLDKEGIAWKEENSGTLLVKLDGQTDFSFLDTDSDEE